MEGIRKKIVILLLFTLFVSSCIAKKFTIAVIPDTQGYVYLRHQKSNLQDKYNYPVNNADFFYNQMAFIADNSVKNGGNFVYAIHLGDLVDDRSVDAEWKITDKAMSILDNQIPYMVVPGNHDYDKWIYTSDKKFSHIEGHTFYSSYFGAESKHFKDKTYYLSNFNEGMDTYSTFSVEEQDFYVLGLECEPSDEVLVWAQQQLDKNPMSPTILVTHSFLSLEYDSGEPGKIAYVPGYLRSKLGGNSPKDIFNKLIKNNNQIFLVLCGHAFWGDNGEAARTDVNAYGNKVYELLSDYQGRQEIINSSLYPNAYCGDGWMRFLEFDLDKQKIYVKTYSTELKKYEKDGDSNFSITFDWDWNTRFPSKRSAQ